MFSTLLTTTFVILFAIQGAFADFWIDTLTLTECEPAHITWQATKGPYNLAVVPESDPCNKVLVDLGDHSGTSITWPNVTLPAGTKVFFSLLDNDDDEAWSAVMTVKSGSSACLPKPTTSTSTSTSHSTSSTGSTLVVPLASPIVSPAPSASSGAVPVGAANAGEIPVSGAMSSARLSGAATILGSLFAIAVVAL